MSYSPQFGKSTTLATTMSDSETASGTLAAAVFTNFTSDFLVIDYDVPAKREVIKCDVTGTAISSITRAQDGTSAVEHTAGAKVGWNLIPSHFTSLANGLGWTATAILLGRNVYTAAGANSSTSTNIDLTNPSITVTCPAGKTIRVRLKLHVTVTSTATNVRFIIGLKDNGSFVGYSSHIIPVDSLLQTLNTEFTFTGLTGSHAFTVNIGNTGGATIAHAPDTNYKTEITVEAL